MIDFDPLIFPYSKNSRASIYLTMSLSVEGFILPRVLIVEDNLELCRRLQKLLETESFIVDVSNEGALGLAMLEQYKYEVVVMDWNLPVMNGPEVVQAFREQGGTTPIIMLTAEGDINSKEAGFAAGADDYLTKPFEPRELIVRLKALLKRAPVVTSNLITIGELVLDVDGHTAKFAGIDLNLQRLEFCLLEFLMRNVGKVFTVEAILERVWPSDSEASVDTVRGYIKTLKKKMLSVNPAPGIRNLHGQGYKLDPEG